MKNRVRQKIALKALSNLMFLELEQWKIGCFKPAKPFMSRKTNKYLNALSPDAKKALVEEVDNRRLEKLFRFLEGMDNEGLSAFMHAVEANKEGVEQCP